MERKREMEDARREGMEDERERYWSGTESKRR